MTVQERKTKVAQLMASKAKKWKEIYGKETEVTLEDKIEYSEFQEKVSKEIESLILPTEKLSIVLTGVAEEGLSHYDIEEALKVEFKPGEGAQYDSEGGQFWMYVRPDLVQKVLRFIDYKFPRQIDLVVDVNNYDDNPWFQNWTQAQRYLETVVGA